MKNNADLYFEIIEKLQNGDLLSKIMPSILIFAKRIDDADLIKWAELEMNGYYNSNPALTDDVVVPEYRIVAGQYLDQHQRIFVIPNATYQFITEYRLRQGVTELETLSGSQRFLTVQDQGMLDIIRDALNASVHSYTFDSGQITGVLAAIKGNLINRLLQIEPKIKEEIESKEKTDDQPGILGPLSMLHPLIAPVASELYQNGHYRQAILDTYILLVNTVKAKSGRHDLDGTSLMQTVFSPKKPVIKISNDADEQMGFMWMFSGSVMGIRNPKAHRLIQQYDPQRTLEWLSFASVLLKVLDDAEVVKEDK